VVVEHLVELILVAMVDLAIHLDEHNQKVDHLDYQFLLCLVGNCQTKNMVELYIDNLDLGNIPRMKAIYLLFVYSFDHNKNHRIHWYKHLCNYHMNNLQLFLLYNNLF
jgi:hypothetical protein